MEAATVPPHAGQRQLHQGGARPPAQGDHHPGTGVPGPEEHPGDGGQNCPAPEKGSGVPGRREPPNRGDRLYPAPADDGEFPLSRAAGPVDGPVQGHQGNDHRRAGKSRGIQGHPADAHALLPEAGCPDAHHRVLRLPQTDGTAQTHAGRVQHVCHVRPARHLLPLENGRPAQAHRRRHQGFPAHLGASEGKIQRLLRPGLRLDHEPQGLLLRQAPHHPAGQWILQRQRYLPRRVQGAAQHHPDGNGERGRKRMDGELHPAQHRA